MPTVLSVKSQNKGGKSAETYQFVTGFYKSVGYANRTSEK